MPADTAATRGNRRQFWLLVAAIWLLALALRLFYFVNARIDDPILGDIVQYVNYALNLVKHGTFSSAVAPDPVTGQVSPDAFRGPGYPFFLAIWTWLAGDGAAAYGLSVFCQIVLGSLLAPLSILWCRRWMTVPASLLVGVVVAVWPHLVVFSSTLLSETLFAVEIVGFMLLALHAFTGRRAASFWTGLVGGLTYLTNPLFAIFPLVVAAILWWRRGRRAATILLTAYLLVVGAWALRNASHPGMTGAWDRAAVNLVQGSWPTYHSAANFKDINPIAASVFDDIKREQTMLVANPRAGLRAIGERFAADPGYYLAWYGWQKPALLWDWSIRIGWGDIYFLKSPHSPYERLGFFRAMRAVCRWINPGILALAALAVVLGVRRAILARSWTEADIGLVLSSLLFLYLTAVHTVLQAEPRYAIAYRPLEFALAVFALAALHAAFRRWTSRATFMASRPVG